MPRPWIRRTISRARIPSTRPHNSDSSRRLDNLERILDLDAFYSSLLDLARIDDGCSAFRNIDVKLLHYRADQMETAPATWNDLAAIARRLCDGAV